MYLKYLEIQLSILRDELSKIHIPENIVDNSSDIIYKKVWSNKQMAIDHLTKLINEKVEEIRLLSQ